ncbi:MAG TPA: CPBP family glutamic-type intramembrane protease [Labilithrix sp.]|nr:CPBP family glutamic-type intramembrane protease [Labilithrix sp.]
MDSPPPEPAERPLSFLAAAAWTLMVAVLLGVMIAIIDAVHPGAFVDVVTVATCKLLAYSLVLFALLRVHEPESSIRQVLALRRPPAILVLLGAAVGAGLSPGAMWLDGIFSRRFPPSPQETEAFQRIFTTPTMGKKIALVLAVVVVMPIFDELFFRGALFTPLKKGRRAETVVLATAAYDTLLAGASPRELASMLAAALVIAWIRAVSGSVFPSIAARVAFFAVQVLPLVLLGDDKLPGALVIGGLALAVASLAGIAAVGKRSARVLDARLLDG